MRLSALYIVTLLTLTSASSDFSSFFFPALDQWFGPLQRRQNNCQSGYNSCSNLGGSSSCCPPNTSCALDQAGHIACCPINAFCTGIINAGASSTTVTALSASTTTVVVGATTSATNGFIVPASTTGGAEAAGGGSTVANAVYPFIYNPTTYANAAACSSAYSHCQTEYTSCTSSLGGSVNGVTVSGAGVGITVQGATATMAAAMSVCSSLSSQACYGLQLGSCSTYTGTGTLINPNAAPTKCARALYGVGVGVAVGIAGQMLA